MDISNKTLAMFLLIAIVISLGSTVFYLNRLDRLQQETPTGFASTDTGTVSLNVQSQISITTADSDTLDFLNCYPNPTFHLFVNSELGKNTSGAIGNCTITNQNNISVRNDGNTNANVTIQADDVGEAQGGNFVAAQSSAASALAYKVTNASRDAGSSGGCYGTMQSTYTNFSTAATEYNACNNLSYGVDTTNSIVVDFEIKLPSDALPGADSVTVTFTGNAVV